jgi:hypothetical protein
MTANGTITNLIYGYTTSTGHTVITQDGVTTTSDSYITGSGNYYESGTRTNDVVDTTRTFDQSAYQSEEMHAVGSGIDNYEKTTAWTTRYQTDTYHADASGITEHWDPDILTAGGRYTKDYKHYWCQVDDPTNCWWIQDEYIDEDTFPGGIPGSEPPGGGPAGGGNEETGSGRPDPVSSFFSGSQRAG